MEHVKPGGGGEGRYSCELLLGVYRPVLQMLILFHDLYQGVPPGYKEQITRKLRKKNTVLIPRRKIKHANNIGILALGNLFVCSQYSLVRKFVLAKVNKDCHVCCFRESMNIFWFF